jgi:hypothetical protein
MQKYVSKTENGVKINFLGEVQKQNIVTMVQNCSTGKCKCMSDETKAKIKDMKVHGDVSIEEIQEALAKSKVLKN